MSLQHQVETRSSLTAPPERRHIRCSRPGGAVLSPDAYDLWLDPGFGDVSALFDLLTPFAARLMRSYPVSARVKPVANDEAECCAPVGAAQSQARLS